MTAATMDPHGRRYTVRLLGSPEGRQWSLVYDVEPPVWRLHRPDEGERPWALLEKPIDADTADDAMQRIDFDSPELQRRVRDIRYGVEQGYGMPVEPPQRY